MGFKKGEYGGTGHTVNWQTAARIAQNYRTILAGGLSPDNIVEAVQTVSPYAIDMNSGVESAPGIKDAVKLKQLFNHIQEFRYGWKADPQTRFPLA